MKHSQTILAPEDCVHDPCLVSSGFEFLSRSHVVSSEVCMDKPVEVRDIESKDSAWREHARDLQQDFLDFKKSKMFKYPEHENIIKRSVRKRQAASVAYNVDKVAIRIIHESVSMQIARLRV